MHPSSTTACSDTNASGDTIVAGLSFALVALINSLARRFGSPTPIETNDLGIASQIQTSQIPFKLPAQKTDCFVVSCCFGCLS